MIRKCSGLPVFTLLNYAVHACYVFRIEAGLYYDQGVKHILKDCYLLVNVLYFLEL